MFEKIKQFFRKKPEVDRFYYLERISVSSPVFRNYTKVTVYEKDGVYYAELTTPIGEHTIACEAGVLSLPKLLAYAKHIATWNHLALAV